MLFRAGAWPPQPTNQILQEPEPPASPPSYSNYREEPYVFEGDYPEMELAVVNQQLLELRSGLEEARTLGDIRLPEGNEATCMFCFTNFASRMCIPCGHRVTCGADTCVDRFVNTPVFHSVTQQSGNIRTTNIRLPLRCPICRAIIGSFIISFLPF